ncbi:hypothetical protein [Parvularcula lutaonensis]|uniref:Uncharacterized protein n=1 Tax=Parvularcula lutaonensis TaxID=491923 RepID=A0ABV7MFD4_9PROT|nr:hypothetical protein [Parvularcula lutaonensis]
MNFAGFSFEESKACLICEHVDAGADIAIAVHDEDGWLQFLCGREDHDSDQAKTVGLGHLRSCLPDARALPLLKPGVVAERTKTGDWTLTRLDEFE